MPSQMMAMAKRTDRARKRSISGTFLSRRRERDVDGRTVEEFRLDGDPCDTRAVVMESDDDAVVFVDDDFDVAIVCARYGHDGGAPLLPLPAFLAFGSRNFVDRVTGALVTFFDEG